MKEMTDPQFEPLGAVNPKLAKMSRYKVCTLIEREIARKLDRVLARDGIELDEDSRDEIVCMSASSIVSYVLAAPDTD